MSVDADTLRQVMRRWATGVTLVIAHHAGKRHGMTVSSFTSISLDPPLVLVSLERGTETHRLVQESGSFAVAILGQDQSELSDRFAGRVPDDADRFAGVATRTSPGGAPIPEGCLAHLDCRVRDSVQAGTHTVFIGEVISAAARGARRPLLYFDRRYRRLQDPDDRTPHDSSPDRG